jgi:nucleotide-binding universal stress UspA family protein
MGLAHRYACPFLKAVGDTAQRSDNVADDVASDSVAGSQAPGVASASSLQRRRRDSNSRWTLIHGGFQNRCLRPLGHSSKDGTSYRNSARLTSMLCAHRARAARRLLATPPMSGPQRILVATDLSEGADEALRQGAAVAARRNSPFAAVHVHNAHLPGAHRGGGSELLRERVQHVTGLPTAELFVDEGRDYAKIIERAEQWHADLIVVGGHGHAGHRHVFGDVAERVVRYAHVSVLVARAPHGHGGVLAATDLSKPSLPALLAGAEEARGRGTRLMVVQAIGFLDIEATYLLRPMTPSAERNSEFGARARQLGSVVEQLGIEATCEILDAPAAAAIVHQATAMNAELVVVGTRGKTGLKRVLLGSVAEKVVRTAPCSVLVVRRQLGHDS